MDAQREEILAKYVTLGVRGRQVFLFWPAVTPSGKLTHRNSHIGSSSED